jgi:zinc transport system ATP-binding protein
MTILSAENLSFNYPGKMLFHHFSLEVEAGEWIGIIGNNGTGKSTLLKVLSQLIPAQLGKVDLVDPLTKKVLKPTERLYVGQHEFSQHEGFPATALEIVLSAYTPLLGFFKNPSAVQKEAARQILIDMGLENDVHTKLSKLSGGQQQRVFIAKALLMQPKILFLDEPTSALDTQFTLKLFQQLKKHQAQGLTIVMITHDLALAKTVSDRIFCLGEGDVLLLEEPQIEEELAHRHTHQGEAHESI